MTSHALFHDLTLIIYDTSSTLYDITFTICVTSQSDTICDITHSVYDISTLYGITHSVMAIQPLCDFTATMSDITPSLSVSSHIMYQFYQTQCMYDITATICMKSYALHMTSHPLFMTSHHFIYDVNSTISNITSIYLTSRTLYQCNHTHCINIRAILYVISHTVYM